MSINQLIEQASDQAAQRHEGCHQEDAAQVESTGGHSVSLANGIAPSDAESSVTTHRETLNCAERKCTTSAIGMMTSTRTLLSHDNDSAQLERTGADIVYGTASELKRPLNECQRNRSQQLLFNAETRAERLSAISLGVAAMRHTCVAGDSWVCVLSLVPSTPSGVFRHTQRNNSIWKAPSKQGVNEPYIQVLTRLYDRQRASVHTDVKIKHFNLKRAPNS